MKLVVVEPYHGGSHARFAADLERHLPFDVHAVTLPARAWKWRMRTAAITLADQVVAARPDVILATSLLNAAELRGLTPSLARVPMALYWHENQLAYPDRVDDPRDVHFALTNAVSALAADRNLFNSAYNRDSLLEGLDEVLSHAPDVDRASWLERIAAKSRVLPVPIDLESEPPCTAPRPPGPLRVLWNHRWEHDKNPEDFFAVLVNLARAGAEFEVALVGESFRSVPDAFAKGVDALGERVVVSGYVDSRTDYLAVLRSCHVVVSTARQEFQGLSVLEAALQGARPLAPRRLSYPELLPASCLYDDLEDLERRLAAWAASPPPVDEELVRDLHVYSWGRLNQDYERELDSLLTGY